MARFQLQCSKRVTLNKLSMFPLLLILVFSAQIYCDNFSWINLPDEHLPYYFSTYPDIANKCYLDTNCPYKMHLDSTKCWGYEDQCAWDKQYSLPACPGDHKGWVRSKFDQQSTFYTQADFGFVKQQRKEMLVMCEPFFPDDSAIECSEHLRFCRGRNILMNFTDLVSRQEPFRYKMDVFSDGQIGGYCELYKDRIMEQADHVSPLQSWGPEMRYFARLNRRPIVEGDCDVVIEKPVFIMKIDATVNMYHHFCDFFNLYATLHLNSTHSSTFSTDVHIIIWETYTYNSAFADTWKVFTHHPIWDLKTFRGKTVCFKNVVFPLLPRMIFGLYYNTPIIWGCEKSGLFHAFAKHVLHRLEIPQYSRNDNRIRITFLSRDTKYRKVLNEDYLIAALQNNELYDVQKIVYNRNISFKQQLEITRNTDMLIGIHGAGLTHLLFLPDWAAVFELYNCEDENCYLDLARIRGLKYLTWEDPEKIYPEDEGHHPDGGSHAKFTNYIFDVDEFVRLVNRAGKHVKNHPDFKSYLDGTLHDEL